MDMKQDARRGGRRGKGGAGSEFEDRTRSGCRRGRQPLQTSRLPARNDFMVGWRIGAIQVCLIGT